MLAEEKATIDELVSVILNQIIFLDGFDYPVTPIEIRYYLDRRYDLADIFLKLGELIAAGVIQEKQGFYFLSGRENIISIRQARYNYSCAKLKIAKRFSFLFSIFPGVTAVAIANFIGRHNLRASSDIDFFIITKPGMIWLSRLYCAGLAKLLNSRPTNKKKKDKICLSFYISEKNLDISKLSLGPDDYYFYYWKRGLAPLYKNKQAWERFLCANNLSPLADRNSLNCVETGGKIGFWEEAAKRLQLKIMSKELLAANKKSDGVIISDQILKLYLRDRRREFTAIFNNKKNEILKTLN